MWNNSPQNLQWLCEKAHREIHNNEEDCSIIEEVKAFITIRKQAEIRERNLIKQRERENVSRKDELPSETHSKS